MLTRLSGKFVSQAASSHLLRGGVAALRLTSVRALRVDALQPSAIGSTHRVGCGCIACARSSVRHISQVRQWTDKELAVVAQKELQDAMKNESLPEPILPPNWTLSESPNDVTVEVTRKYGDEDITVRWVLEPPPDSYPESEEEMQQREQELAEEANNPNGTPANTEETALKARAEEDAEEEMNEEDNDPLLGLTQSFTVTIFKPKQNKAMMFECLADSGHVFINAVVPYEDGKSALSNDFQKMYDRNFLYQGPVIADIDADLRAMLWDYLERRGVNDELARFVLEYAIYHEKASYVKWLERLRDFVKPAGPAVLPNPKK